VFRLTTVTTGLRTNFFRSFRSMSPKMRSICNVNALINEAFEPHLLRENLPPTKKTGMELRRAILLQAYEEALKNHNAPSLLFRRIESLPEDLSFDNKLQWFSDELFAHPAMPVITAHPTRVLSNEATFALTEITDDLMRLKQQKISFEHVTAFKAQLTESIRNWARGAMVPSTNLTPEDEAEFALFLYKRILATFPAFRQAVLTKFRTEHGGSEAHVASALNDAIMLSYRNIFSWCMADFDGNNKRTRKTIATTLPLQQRAILELYITALQRILKKLDATQHPSEITTLQDMHDYFQRCAKAIETGIWFDLSASQKTKKRTKLILDNMGSLLEARSNADERALSQDLFALHDMIDLAGFFGGLKEYTRQTTQLNQRVLNDLAAVLSIYHADIQRMMDKRTYSTLPLPEKQTFLQLLRTEPHYFETLKQNTSWFQEETLQEMDRLSFILEHTDLFPSYITSDTDNKNNFDELLILLRFASYLSGSLRIGQIREHALNTLPLCETPKDLGRFIEIALAMFEDPAIRNKIIESGFFSYVGGPSDLGKKGGIFVYVSLLRVLRQALNVLEKYQQMDPRLNTITLRVLHGFGGDMKRRNGSSANELHATQQGLEAWRVLGATGAYPAFLHRVIGQPSESYLRAEELVQLEAHHPEAFNALAVMEAQGTATFQDFIESPNNKNLLLKLTSLSLEKHLNISSRAGAKINMEDPTNVRAIGMVNLYLITGIQWDVFMSVHGLLDLPEDTTQHFPCLFNNLTVMKDIVYKILFSLAVSNFPRAWERINTEDDATLSATLTHIETNAARILTQSIQYFSPAQQAKAKVYLDEAKQNNTPVHEMALGLMDVLGGHDLTCLAAETRELLPHFETLAACIKAFEANPTPDIIENVLLACRGLPLAAGPSMIAELTSPLRQELFMAQEDNYEAPGM